MWERPSPWSVYYVLAETQADAMKFFGIMPGDEPYYEFMSKPYNGKKKAGTKIRIS